MPTEFVNLITGKSIPIAEELAAKKKCVAHVHANKNITCMNHFQCNECWYAWQDFLEEK